MKKPSLSTVMLYAFYAVIWSVIAIVEVVHRIYSDSGIFFILNILWALIWIAAFIVNLKRYCSGKEE